MPAKKKQPASAAAAAASSSADPAVRAEQIKNEGNALFSDGKFAEAIVKFSEAIAVCPTLTAPWLNRAACHLELEQWEPALADAEEALKLDPNNAKACFRKGAALCELGRHGEAYGPLCAAFRAAPDDDAIFARLVECHRAGVRPDDATVEDAIRINTQAVDLGGDPSTLKEKMSLLKQALALWPANATYWEDLSSACLEQSDWSASLHAAERALLLVPEINWAMCYKARAILELQRYHEARDAYRAMLAKPLGWFTYDEQNRADATRELAVCEMWCIAIDQRKTLLEFSRGWTRGRPSSWREDNLTEAWEGVNHDEDSGNITKIHVDKVSGAINAEMMRRLDEVFPKLQVLLLRDHQLRGDIGCLDRLPRGLTTCVLTGSVGDVTAAAQRQNARSSSQQIHALKGGRELTGMLSFAALPASLESLGLVACNFTNPPDAESLDWERMSHLTKLATLGFSGNRFGGRVLVEYLPRSITMLALDNNNFSGTAKWEALPPALEYLCIKDNDFEGTLNLNALPSTLKSCVLVDNPNLQLVCSLEQHESLAWVSKCNEFRCEGMKIFEQSSGAMLTDTQLVALVRMRAKKQQTAAPAAANNSETGAAAAAAASSSAQPQQQPQQKEHLVDEDYMRFLDEIQAKCEREDRELLEQREREEAEKREAAAKEAKE